MPARTRETVAGDTPACAATSASVGAVEDLRRLTGAVVGARPRRTAACHGPRSPVPSMPSLFRVCPLGRGAVDSLTPVRPEHHVLIQRVLVAMECEPYGGTPELLVGDVYRRQSRLRSAPSGMSSYPATEMSWGTRRPASRSAASTPLATTSVMPKTAVKRCPGPASLGLMVTGLAIEVAAGKRARDRRPGRAPCGRG